MFFLALTSLKHVAYPMILLWLSFSLTLHLISLFLQGHNRSSVLFYRGNSVSIQMRDHVRDNITCARHALQVFPQGNC